MIGVGVDAMLKLGEFVRPAPGVISTFVNVLGWLVSRFVMVGQWFNGQALGAAIAEHLVGCARCRAEVESFRGVRLAELT